MTVLDIIHGAGGVCSVARALGVRPQAVSNWAARNLVPPRRVPALARLTGLSLFEIRPDLFDAPAPAEPEPAPPAPADAT